MNSTDLYTGREGFLEAFSHAEGKNLFPGREEIRREAIQRFAELGIPDTKHEEWKYTDLNAIRKTCFRFPETLISKLSAEDIKPFLLAGDAAMVLVFVNGQFNKSLSRTSTLSAGMIVGNLAEHVNHPAVLEHFANHAPYRKETFVALNTAFTNDGAFIFFPQDHSLEAPVHFLYINDSRDAATVVNSRNLVIVEKGAKVNVLESYHSIGNIHSGFTNSVTEVIIHENASVEFEKIQLENKLAFHIGYTQVTQKKNSNWNSSTITLGGAIVRNNLHIALTEPNANAHLYGLMILDGTELADNHTLVDHISPNCYSNELYKSILEDHARGVFNGKIMVWKDAQKTNAYQSNKNILLSDDASMNTKPQLEIFADDVKCSHGATTGQLDEDALFYLRSRGIGLTEARAFLTIAFAGNVLENISSDSLREYLMNHITEKLTKGL